MRRLGIANLSRVATLVVVAACGIDADLFGEEQGHGFENATGAAGANITAAGGRNNLGGGGADAQGASGGVCTGPRVGLFLRDVDLVLVVDRSGSMGNGVAGSKWDVQANGLLQFVSSSKSGGSSTRVALIYNPHSGFGDQCDINSYDPPPLSLTAKASDVKTSLANHTAQGLSSWSGALAGGLRYAVKVKKALPQHVVLTVFMVDGDATQCEATSVPELGVLAAKALDKGVHTFTIAYPSDVTITDLSSIAQAGGTKQAIDLTGPGDMQNLDAALEDIRLRSLYCEWAIPPTPAGGDPDPNGLDVVFTPSTQAVEEVVPRVNNENACGQSPGWFFDSPTSPSAIGLCPSTCQRVKMDISPTVDVVFGCGAG